MMQASDHYQLLDVGDGARLERFAERIVDRPHPTALGARGDPGAWRSADLRFDRDGGWNGSTEARVPWPCAVGGVVLELRPTEAGQVGLFPEHLAMLPWLTTRVAHLTADPTRPEGQPPIVLNLFAYTGLATLALAELGAAVTHVDSSRPTVAWARHNAARSILSDRPIRWIVDDAVAFTGRELRRGRHYDGLVLDPPSYGHGPAGQAWRIEEDLPGLLDDATRLLRPEAFVLITAHSPGFDGDRLAATLAAALGQPAGGVERGNLNVLTEDGRRLELGAFARWAAEAS
jgi:23S rRNA (cytosine1962-C5)-methyltransferase